MRGLRPAVAPTAHMDVLRVSLGVLLGISMAALLLYGARSQGWLGGWALFAPLGATAVLAFAVHSGPLSQPWSCVVGNVVSALWAMLVVAWLPAQWAPPVAVAGAVACMLLTRSLHPPGGALAFLLAQEAQAGIYHPWTYAFVPLGVMTLLIVLLAMGYHRLWGKTYPLHSRAAAPTHSTPSRPVAGLTQGELQGLLARFDLDHNLTARELGRLLEAAEEQALNNRFARTACGQVMTAQPHTCAPGDSLAAVAAQFQQHSIKSLPVVDDAGRLLGVVTRQALLDWLWKQVQPAAEAPAPRNDAAPTQEAVAPAAATKGWWPRQIWQRWRAPVVAAAVAAAAPLTLPRTAAELMHEVPLSVQDSTPVAQLLDALAVHTVPFVAVLQGERLVGLITRTDIVRLLLK